VRQARIAVLLSGHGYGHLTRTANVLEALCRVQPLSLRVMTSAPRSLWPEALTPFTAEWIEEPCDAAIVQADDLRVDQSATRREVASWAQRTGARLAGVIDRLTSDGERPCLVVGDVPPLAFDAAAALGLPSVAIANFSWDWIYQQLHAMPAAELARRAYEKADLLVELTPAAPMPAFRRRVRVGTVGRDSSGHREAARAALGAAPTDCLVLLAFRAPTMSEITLPSPRDGVIFIGMQPLREARADTMRIRADVGFAAVLAASDVVVAKTGYGILADCAATGRPLLWVAREGFPEDQVLEAWLAEQPWARRVDRRALAAGSWAADLAAVARAKAPPPVGAEPVAAAADAIAGLLS
jgi:hypothetical protein